MLKTIFEVVLAVVAIDILALLLFVAKKVAARIIARKLGVYKENEESITEKTLKKLENAKKEAEESERKNKKIKQDFKNRKIDINEYYEKNYGYIPGNGDYSNPVPPNRNNNNEEFDASSGQFIFKDIQIVDYNKLEGLTEEEKKFIIFLKPSGKEDNNDIVDDEIDGKVVSFKVRNSSGDLEEKTIELCNLRNVLYDSAKAWNNYQKDPENYKDFDDLELEKEDFSSFINLFSKVLFNDGILISYKDEEDKWNYFKDEDREIDYDKLERLTSSERHFVHFLKNKSQEDVVVLFIRNKSGDGKLEKIEVLSSKLKKPLKLATKKWCNIEDKEGMSFIELLSSEIKLLKGGKKTYNETEYTRVNGKFVSRTFQKKVTEEDKVLVSYEDDGESFPLKEEFMVDYRDLLGLSDEEKKFVYFLNTTKEKSVRGQIYNYQEDKGLEEKDFNVEDLKTALRETADIWIKEKGVVKSEDGWDDISFIELFSSKCKALNGKTLISYKDNIEDWQFFHIKLEGLTDNEIEFLRLLQNKYEGDYVNVKVKTYFSNEIKEKVVAINKQTIVSLKQAARNWMNTENKENASFIKLLSKELFYSEDVLISYKNDIEWKPLSDGSKINNKSFDQNKKEDSLLNGSFSSSTSD